MSQSLRMSRSMGRHISSSWVARICGLMVLLLSWAGAAQAATLTLTWDPDPEPDVAGYSLYWGSHSGVYTNSVDVGNQTSWQVTGLVNGTPYYFVVRAYNTSSMWSAPSVEVSRRV